MKELKIDWSEHPSLLELDKHIADVFNGATSKEWSEGAYKKTGCLADMKHTAKNYVEEMMERWQKVLEKIDGLPEDTQRSYKVDENGEIPED